MCSDQVSRRTSSDYPLNNWADNDSDNLPGMRQVGPGDYHPLQQAMQTAFQQGGTQPLPFQGVQQHAMLNLPQPLPLGAYQVTNLAPNAAIQLAQIPPQVPQTPPTQLNIQVPVPNGATQAWTPNQSCLGDDLVKNIRTHGGALKAQYEAEIQQKVTQGAMVAHLLTSANAPMDLTEKQVTDLMWYMQARGELKTNTNNAPEITYTLPDPHGYIRQSLDRTKSSTNSGLAYERASSHLTGFQDTAPSNSPRGVNFHVAPNGLGDLDRTLPNGKGTILYQSMTQGTYGFPENRVFIKPEDHGMYYSPPKSIRNPDPNAPWREPIEHDKRDALAHTGGLIGSIARKATNNNSPLGSFKERLPPEVSNEYKALIKSAPSGIAILLSANDPTGDSSGLHVMGTNIQQALNSLPPNAPTGKGTPKQALLDFQQKYVTTNNVVYDNPTRRIGQEIIFNAPDLTMPTPQRPMTQLPQNTAAQGGGTVTTTQTNSTNSSNSSG